MIADLSNCFLLYSRVVDDCGQPMRILANSIGIELAWEYYVDQTCSKKTTCSMPIYIDVTTQKKAITYTTPPQLLRIYILVRINIPNELSHTERREQNA